MQHKLYKTHRKRTYYQLRRLSTITLSVVFGLLAIIVPLTLNVGAQSQTSSIHDSSESSTSQVTESSIISSSDTLEDNQPLIITRRQA